MIEKIKSVFSKFDEWLKYFIVIMFIISVFYAIFVAIFGNKKNYKEVTYSDAEDFVTIYSDDSSYNEKLVKGYNEYYTVKSAVDNFFFNVSEEKYNDLYSILDSTLKKEYSQKEFKNLMSNVSTDFIDNYMDASYLKKVTNLSHYQYICEIIYDDFNMYIGIRLNSNSDTYSVFYLKIGD